MPPDKNRNYGFTAGEILLHELREKWQAVRIAGQIIKKQKRRITKLEYKFAQAAAVKDQTKYRKACGLPFAEIVQIGGDKKGYRFTYTNEKKTKSVSVLIKVPSMKVTPMPDPAKKQKGK